MNLKDFHQKVAFPTPPLDFYQCMMDERRHSSFTASPCHIEDIEGSLFTAYDGYINGKNIVLERGKRIVQLWQAKEESWPENYWSEIVFAIKEHPEGCQIDFFHMGIPENLYEQISKGWETYYWEPLRFYLDR